LGVEKIMEEIKVPKDEGKGARFTGELVSEACSSPNRMNRFFSGSSGRWKVLRLYKTKGGKFVCQSIGCTQHQGEKDRYDFAVCESDAEVIEFFGHSDLAKEIYLAAGIDDDEVVD
jgi:hypothetical protein